MAKRSAFRAWFKAQFMFLPLLPDRRAKLARRVRDLRVALNLAEAQLLTDDMLNQKYQAALYAWAASRSDDGTEKR